MNPWEEDQTLNKSEFSLFIEAKLSRVQCRSKFKYSHSFHSDVGGTGRPFLSSTFLAKPAVFNVINKSKLNVLHHYSWDATAPRADVFVA